MSRTCGTCVACCVYLRIESATLSKPGMQHCPHLAAAEPEIAGENGERRVCYTGASEHNCKVMGTAVRPVECAGYECLWLQGYGEEADRPDRCGVLLDRLKQIGNAVEAKPLWDGAADRLGGSAAIRRISRQKGMPALVTSFYERRLDRVEGRP